METSPNVINTASPAGQSGQCDNFHCQRIRLDGSPFMAQCCDPATFRMILKDKDNGLVKTVKRCDACRAVLHANGSPVEIIHENQI